MNTHSFLEGKEIHRALASGDQPLRILRGIRLSISAGEWVSINGPSGSGKSTLLGILAGLDIPTSGEVWLDGVQLDGLAENRMARIRNEKIGMVFQSFYLIPTMTALENVAAPLLWLRCCSTKPRISREHLFRGVENEFA